MKARVLVAVALVAAVAVALVWSVASSDATDAAAGRGHGRPNGTARPKQADLVAADERIVSPHVGATTVSPPTPETLEAWFQDLPRAEDIPADAHFAPPAIARSGERFGTIFEAVSQSPSYQSEAARFFGRCTEDGTVLDGIRALCLHNWRTFRENPDAIEPLSDDRIRRIADFLPKNPRF